MGGQVTSTAGITSVTPSGAGSGQGTLTASALLWWWMAIIGQWAFLYYLAGFYAPSTLTGHFAEWNRNHMLLKGYVAGQPAWNLNFGAHVLLAAMIAFGGTLQIIPQIRERAIWFHRWNGRAFMLTALAGASTGLWMTWAGHVSVGGGGPTGEIAISVNALLIMLFTAAAWASARAGRIDVHRRWALRLFMVANGVWFLRLGLFSWYVLTKGAGLTDSLDGPMNFVFDFACYLLPLAILELYLRAKDHGSAGGRVFVAAIVFASAAYMCIGIFALSMIEWPLVRLS